MAGNPDNLIPNSERTPEELKEMTRKGGIKSGEVRREKKLMTQIYTEWLEREHNIINKEGMKEKISGREMFSRAMGKITSRGDSATVSMMKEIREATEGTKTQLTGNDGEPITVNINIVGIEPDKKP